MLENYPQDESNIIGFDIQFGTGYISGGISKAFCIRIPYTEYNRITNSFWSNYDRFKDFMYEHIPLMKTFTVGQ